MELLAFGDNTFGQLGCNSNFEKDDFKITKVPERVQIKANSLACITTNLMFTLFIDHDGTMRIAGKNLNEIERRIPTEYKTTSKELSQNSNKMLSASIGANNLVLFLTKGGDAFCQQNDESHLVPQYFPYPKRIVGVFADEKLAFIDEDGYLIFQNRVFNFGEPAVDFFSCSKFNCVLTISGKIYFYNGEQFVYSKLQDVKQIAGFSQHMLILMNNGYVYALGDNSKNQLGLKDVEFVNELTVLPIMNVKKVATGGGHSMFLTNDGKVLCCGMNNFYQICAQDIECFQEITMHGFENVSDIICGENHTFLIMKGDSLVSSTQTYFSRIKEKINMLEEKVRSLSETLSSTFDNMSDKEFSDTIMNDIMVENLGQIGRGTNSEVFKVRNKANQKIMAMKVYKRIDENSIEHLLREIDITRLSNHPCVVQFIGVKLNDKSIFFEYLEKGRIDEIKDSLWNNTRKAMAFMEIAKGMEYLHSKKFIHRDIKPANILLTKTLHAKICDFSEGKILETDTENTGNVGTSCYMSPEMLDNSSYNEKTDVFSFAMTLYAIIAGKKPSIPMQKLFDGERPELPDSITPLLQKIISLCWSSKPQDRPDFKEVVHMMKTGNFMLFDDIDPYIIEDRLVQIEEYEKQHNCM